MKTARKVYTIDVTRTASSVALEVTRPYGAKVDRDDLVLIRDWLTSYLANEPTPQQGEER